MLIVLQFQNIASGAIFIHNLSLSLSNDFSCPGRTKPVECSSGSYSDAGEEGCTTCPKGFYCPENALKAPKACQLGEYTDKEGQTNCSICSTGYFCNDTKTPPEQCETGYYSEAKMSACSVCPAGYRYVIFIYFMEWLLFFTSNFR